VTAWAAAAASVADDALVELAVSKELPFAVVAVHTTGSGFTWSASKRVHPRVLQHDHGLVLVGIGIDRLL
jgi:hypothetical protein